MKLLQDKTHHVLSTLTRQHHTLSLLSTFTGGLLLLRLPELFTLKYAGGHGTDVDTSLCHALLVAVPYPIPILDTIRFYLLRVR